MRWLDRVLGRPEKRAITLSDFGALGLLDAPSTSGVTVNERTAYGLPAFWNGVNVISSQIGTLPRAVYKRLEGDERERDRTTPAARLMAQPNEMMTDIVFWETLMGHALTWGNGYAEIEFDRASRPIALWPVAPDSITPVIENKRLRYKVSNTGETLPPEIIYHVPGLGFDGLKGYSVVTMLKEALSQDMAVKRFGASFFGNGATLGLTFEHPGTLSDEAYQRLIQSINDDHRGPGKAHKTKILEEGMKANKGGGVQPEDAQFLQTQEFGVEEIARILNINPVKLKAKTGERPGGNFEAIQIEFLTDTLRPWLVRIEQEANRKLFPPSQRSTYYVEHLVDAILRVDNAARMAGYKSLFDMGVINAAQIARKENLPKPDPPKELPTVKVLPAETVKALPPAPNDRQMRIALRALVADAVARYGQRESDRLKRAVRRGAEGLSDLDSFYADEAMVFRGYLAPAVRAVLAHAGSDGDAEEVTGGLVSAYVERSKEELLALPAKDIEERASHLLASWRDSRPIDVAERVLADYGGNHAA